MNNTMKMRLGALGVKPEYLPPLAPCSCRNPELDKNYHTFEELWKIRCSFCGMETEKHPLLEFAIASWNQETSTPRNRHGQGFVRVYMPHYYYSKQERYYVQVALIETMEEVTGETYHYIRILEEKTRRKNRRKNPNYYPLAEGVSAYKNGDTYFLVRG